MLIPCRLGAFCIRGFASSRRCYKAGDLIDSFDARTVGDNRCEVIHHGIHHFDLMWLVGSEVNALRFGQ